MTQQEGQKRYEQKSVSALRDYASSLGIHSADVQEYLGKKVGVHQLNKADLVKLHLAMDADNRGLGDLLT